MNGFNQEFQGVYSQIMANKNMQEYEKRDRLLTI